MLPDSKSPLVTKLVAHAPEERPRARRVEEMVFFIGFIGGLTWFLNMSMTFKNIKGKIATFRLQHKALVNRILD